MIEVIKRNENGRAEEYKCVCGQVLYSHGPGRDVGCEHCGRSFNSAGQELAPRSQWGEETGETASDYDRGFANPEQAFEGND